MSTQLSGRQKSIRRELRRRYLFPCKGYWSSLQRDAAPPDVITGDSTSDSYNVEVSSQEGQLLRRKGSDYYNEPDVTAQVGLLESVSKNMGYNMVCRQMLDVQYPSTIPGAITGPTALYGDSTDLNHAGQLYVLTSTQGTRKVLGHEMGTIATPGTTHYPRSTASVVPNFRMIPMPYMTGGTNGGAGTATAAVGYSRCTYSMQRLFLAGGSFKALYAGGNVLWPSLHATPGKWNGKANPSTTTGSEVVSIRPWGNLPPLYPPTATAGTASSGTNDKVWWDGDQFYVSLVFQMEDGSFSAPVQPRPKSATLTNGYGLVTVGSSSGIASYRTVEYTNIQIGPPGTKARILCRTRKTNVSTAASATRPTGMPVQGATSDIDSGGQKLYVFAVIKNNTQTTYSDAGSSDDSSLRDDPIAIRTDGIWPLPARYAFEMERRVGVAYTRRQHPCAIILAPTGRVASRDMNYDEAGNPGDGVASPVTPYGTFAYAWQLLHTSANDVRTYTLYLKKVSIGSGVATSQSITITATMTVQDLIDTINATTVASNANEWAAQSVPGTDPNILARNLQASAVVFTSGIPVTAGGLVTDPYNEFRDVAIGMRISSNGGTGSIPARAVVNSRTGTNLLTYSDENGAAVSGTAGTPTNIMVWSDTGDDSWSSDASWASATSAGNVRSYSAVLPAIIAFSGLAYPGTAGYVDRTSIDRQGLMYTSATPGSSSLASQAFYNAEGTRHQIPQSAGILMGCDIAYPNVIVKGSDGIFVLKNVKGANTGDDVDYHLFPLSPRGRGCIQYGTGISGDGWAGYLTREGYIVTDGEREVVISNPLFDPATGRGIMSSQCVAQAATNGIADLPAYQTAFAAIADSKIRLTFSIAASAEIVTCVYDFSKGVEASGLAEVLGTGEGFPWSAPHLLRTGAMLRTWDGKLYAANDDNGGSTANGTIWQLETGLYDKPVKARSVTNVAALGNSSFVAITNYLASNYAYIYVQKLNPLGSPQWGVLGTQALAYSGTPTTAPIADVCADETGTGCVVAAGIWKSSGFVEGYVQKINASGINQWGSGTKFSNSTTTGDVSNIKICGDGLGNYFILRLDLSTTAGVYLQKVDTNGNLLWANPGAQVTTSGGHVPKFVISDGVGGCFVGYVRFNGASNEIRVQRYDSTGTVYTGWPAAPGRNLGATVTTPTDNLQGFQSSTTPGTVYAVRHATAATTFRSSVNSAGTAGSDSTDLNPSASAPYGIAAVSDDAGGMYLAYIDTGGTYQLQVIRVDAAGNFVWTALTNNRLTLYTYTNTTGNQVVRIQKDGTGGVYVCWDDKDATGGTIWTTRIQRVKSDGTAAWAANLLVSNSSSHVSQPVMSTDGANGAIVYWTSQTFGSRAITYGQRVSPAGAQLWGVAGIDVSHEGHNLAVSCAYSGAAAQETSASVLDNTISGSLVSATGVITATTAGQFRQVPVGGVITGSGITGSAVVSTKDTSGNTITCVGTFSGNTTNVPYTCYGREVEAQAYLCCDHLKEVGGLFSGQFMNVAYACPTGEEMGLLHSYDYARASQARVTTTTSMPATGAANTTTHRAPPDQPLVDLPSLNRSPGGVQEFAVFFRNGSMGVDTQSRGEFWGLELTARRLVAYI